MITVQYDPKNGTVISDGLIRMWVDNLVHAHKHGSSPNQIVSSEAVILELRIRVAKKEITREELVLLFDDGNTIIKLPLEENGQQAYGWPRGCCDLYETMNFEMRHAMLGKG
jgi:hypothetical protein